jgi:formate dehydrogenase iron-sulfur subunit
LPPDPKLPSRNLVPSSLYALLGAIMVGLAGIFNFRNRETGKPGEAQP